MYSKSYVALRTKMQAFQALSMSRLMYNAHTWCSASDDDLQKWQNHMRKPVGLMVKHVLMGTPPTHLETEDLFGMADMLPPIDQLHLARLRYFKRLIQYCPQALWTCLTATVGTHHSWLDALHASNPVDGSPRFYPHCFGPIDADSASDWIPWIAMDANWKGRLRAAAAACRRHRRAVAEYHIWQKRFDRTFLAGGGTLPVQQSAQSETWSCDNCNKTFASKKALATHASRVHGYRRIVKFYALGNSCNACCKCYHSRQRFIEHLKYVPSCLDTLQACFPALDDETVQALDREDQAHTLAMRQQGWWATKAMQPVRKLLGPPLPPAGSPEAAVMKGKWDQRLQPAGTAFQNLQGRRLTEPDREPQVLLFSADIPAFVFQSTFGPNQGDDRFAVGSLAREHARLHIKTLVFVHVFSGFRRHNDLAPVA